MTLPFFVSEKATFAREFERSVFRNTFDDSSIAAAFRSQDDSAALVSHCACVRFKVFTLFLSLRFGQSASLPTSRLPVTAAADPDLLSQLEKLKKINRDLYKLFVRKQVTAALSEDNRK